MTKQEDGLFLLEVLIDKIVFLKSPCFSDNDFKTCVNIECLSIEPLEICDNEPGACAVKSSGPYVKIFNNGKSCLFSLKQGDISKAMSKFPIKVTVFKSLPCGCLPAKIIIGQCTIDMTKEFVEARQSFLQDPNCISYQALKDAFRLVGHDDEEFGDITMFLRISCFGNMIITKFQGPGSPSNFGTGKKSMIVDRSCNPKKGFQSKQNVCACGIVHEVDGDAGTSDGQPFNQGGGSGVCQPGRDPYNSMPCQDTEEQPQMACRNTDQYCLHIPKGRSKQFEEIGTNLGGNELKIKVPASASIIKKISQTHCAMQCPYTKRANEGPCEPPCGKNQISLALPSEAICCQGAQPAGTQFTCTTEGCIQASKHGQQNALARGDNKQNASAELNNQDVFVLKVAKTALQGDRKCKLELELVTPKGPDKIQPLKTKNTCLQSDLDCECLVKPLKKPKLKKNL